MKINYTNQTNEDTTAYEKLINRVIKKTKRPFNIIFVNQDEIKEINKQYRQIDLVTDVISFAMDEGDTFIKSEELGDIFICLDQAIVQAKEFNHSIDREVAFLAVHGYLHLLGYDHQNSLDEEVMIKKQKEILDKAKLGR